MRYDYVQTMANAAQIHCMLCLNMHTETQRESAFLANMNGKGAFTARWNSLFILFKFYYLAKSGTLVLVFGISEF